MKTCQHCGAPLVAAPNAKYCRDTCAGEVKAQQTAERQRGQEPEHDGPPTELGWEAAWAAAEQRVKVQSQRMVINPQHGKRGQPLYIPDRRQSS